MFFWQAFAINRMIYDADFTWFSLISPEFPLISGGFLFGQQLRLLVFPVFFRSFMACTSWWTLQALHAEVRSMAQLALLGSWKRKAMRVRPRGPRNATKWHFMASRFHGSGSMDALCFSVSMDCCQGTFKGHTAKERNKRCSFRLRAVTGTEHKTDISNHFCTWTTSFIIFIVGLGMSGINCQQPSASPSSRKQAEWQFCAIAGLGPFLIQPSWNIWQLKKP